MVLNVVGSNPTIYPLFFDQMAEWLDAINCKFIYNGSIPFLVFWGYGLKVEFIVCNYRKTVQYRLSPYKKSRVKHGSLVSLIS